MFRRYGNWLLLFCASILLFAIACAPETIRRTSAPVPQPSGEMHYIASRDGMLLDINRATQQELMELPSIGETLAARIIEYRDANGSFSYIEALTLVSGIGEGTLQAISPYITAK